MRVAPPERGVWEYHGHGLVAVNYSLDWSFFGDGGTRTFASVWSMDIESTGGSRTRGRRQAAGDGRKSLRRGNLDRSRTDVYDRFIGDAVPLWLHKRCRYSGRGARPTDTRERVSSRSTAKRTQAWWLLRMVILSGRAGNLASVHQHLRSGAIHLHAILN